MTTAVPQERASRRPITGRTVLGWMLAFFGVIFAANAALIYLAIASFPGLEVESSYKAGQEFQAEVQAANAQAARGWTVDVTAVPDANGAVISARFADRTGAPERQLTVDVALEHPTDDRHDHRVTLAEVAPGLYSAEVPGLGAGRWLIDLEARAGGERLFRSRNAVVLAN